MNGCEIKGERARFPRGLCRSWISKAPSQFTQFARNPSRSVKIGGNNTVFAPVYGPPFVRALDGERRYAQIEDFRNFVKLAFLCPGIHHSGGTVCEPVDLPVTKRHLEMSYAHIKYSDKPFMGSVTSAERAEDTVKMANIVFGDDFVQKNTVLISLINANSPMTWDSTMLGALKVYARANQAVITTPFILSGAMAPVTPVGVLAQTLAEAMSGMAFAQMVKAGSPVVFGSFASSTAQTYPASTEHARYGLGFAAGISLAMKKNSKNYKQYVLLGDAECSEGSVWESALFASFHKLKNLVAIVDRNNIGALDYLTNFTSIEPFKKKWESFGWFVQEVDGHSISDLLKSFENCKRSNKPNIIIAKTTKGKGIKLLENNPIWHVKKLEDPNDILQAKKELEK